LTRQLVERHGGTVAVHSAPNNGSVFTIALSLPRTAPAHVPAPALTTL
jgi:signal transduction histidine kinase